MNTLKAELLTGKPIFFSNERQQFESGSDDLRMARVIFSGKDSGLPSWAQGFRITFAGAVIHSCSTFKSLERRLQILIEKWDLERMEVDQDGEPIFKF